MPTRKSKAARRKSTSRSAGRARAKPKRAVSAARPKRAVARRPAAAHRPAAPKPAPTSSPSAIGLMSHHLDYTSHDLEGVKRFYTEVLGFKDFNQDPRFNYLMVKTSPTSSVGFMPPMPGPPEQWRPDLDAWEAQTRQLSFLPRTLLPMVGKVAEAGQRRDRFATKDGEERDREPDAQPREDDRKGRRQQHEAEELDIGRAHRFRREHFVARQRAAMGMAGVP